MHRFQRKGCQMAARSGFVAMLALFVALALCSCGLQTTPMHPSERPPVQHSVLPPRPTSGIRGTNEFIGGPLGAATSTPRPWQSVIVVHVGRGGGRVVARVQTDTSGHFEIELPPGEYTLKVERGTSKAVKVLPGSFTTTDIVTPAG
jgi:hypothetical protein